MLRPRIHATHHGALSATTMCVYAESFARPTAQAGLQWSLFKIQRRCCAYTGVSKHTSHAQVASAAVTAAAGAQASKPRTDPAQATFLTVIVPHNLHEIAVLADNETATCMLPSPAVPGHKRNGTGVCSGRAWPSVILICPSCSRPPSMRACRAGAACCTCTSFAKRAAAVGTGAAPGWR